MATEARFELKVLSAGVDSNVASGVAWTCNVSGDIMSCLSRGIEGGFARSIGFACIHIIESDFNRGIVCGFARERLVYTRH